MRVEIRAWTSALLTAVLLSGVARAFAFPAASAGGVPHPLASELAAQERDDGGYGLIDNRPSRQSLIAARQSARDERAALAAQEIDLQHRLSEVRIDEATGGCTVSIETDHGPERFTADEYVRAVKRAQDTQKSNGFLYVLFNITRPWGFVWIGAGFLAQALFTYRMILQWWASEKHKRSIVPVGYWWGSLFGGMLLFAYFVWRKDIVGYLGQSTGVFIYARNLALIYRGRRIEAEGARPLDPREPAPEAAP